MGFFSKFLSLVMRRLRVAPREKVRRRLNKPMMMKVKRVGSGNLVNSPNSNLGL